MIYLEYIVPLTKNAVLKEKIEWSNEVKNSLKLSKYCHFSEC